MHAIRRWLPIILAVPLLGVALAAPARAAGKLTVTDAWIRAGAPGAPMLAGYATLGNSGDAPVSVLTVQSDVFRMASLHETIVQDDVAKMREIHKLDIAPGETVKLSPGAKHLMLMDPRRDVADGEKVQVTFLLGDGNRVETYFDVTGVDKADQPAPAKP